MKKVDIVSVHRILKKEYEKFNTPIVELIQAQTKDPFKVLVATILSARTKDETTAAACRKLFRVAGDKSKLSELSIKQIEKLIFPVGFYHNKAKFLKRLPGVLESLYDGKVPSTVDELTRLPGVGRKTANIVVAVAFDKPAIGVDVHVHRISNRLGYVKTRTPFDTEMALRKTVPKKLWSTINTYLVAFGQGLCRPTSPFCSKCPILEHCNRIGVEQSR